MTLTKAEDWEKTVLDADHELLLSRDIDRRLVSS